ncbi:polysaccharide deacetylase family protein [Shumkonia mesophila]|uniref:polysaccharide deacetylase family protein n=1 Tax=Shumkonia mesophila TaxID=2838854 RepID=UPI00293469BF|nr:polysaccharide deacetylase family protein [Shumkonia mesophila]
MGYRIRFVALSAVAALCLPVLPGAASAAESAVILMYHRIGDDRYPTTNIRIDQFESHLAELKAGGYHVLPVPEIVAAIREGKPLPDRAVGITIDDAYRSVFENGWPRLKAAGFSFTLFMATDPVDQASAGANSEYMTWDHVRELVAGGVTVGNHTASHLHMADASPEQNRREIERAAARFQENLGMKPALFAYPYGEAGLATARLVADMGFPIAFGQFSGAIGPDPELYYLPRFALNETYGDIKRFRQVASAVAMSVTDVTPADPLVGAINPPAIGFTVRRPTQGLERLTCYMSSEKSNLERLGDTRFEVRVQKPFAKGRARLNCTMPAADGRWYWYGRQFYVGR